MAIQLMSFILTQFEAFWKACSEIKDRTETIDKFHHRDSISKMFHRNLTLYWDRLWKHL